MLPTISLSKPIIPLSIPSYSYSYSHSHFLFKPTHFTSFHLKKTQLICKKTQPMKLSVCKSSEKEETTTETVEEKMPEKKKPLYAHSLPCIETWLRELGFCQTADDPAAWVVEKSDWHAHLNLDVTDLYIRYLKTGPGNLEKDVERRFSYALSREDIENAILGGP